MEGRKLLNRVYTARRALIISLIGGLLLTGVATLAHFNRSWVLDADFHIVYAFVSNTLIFFFILFFNFTVIRSNMDTGWRYVVCVLGSLLLAAGLSLLSGIIRRMVYDDLSVMDTNRLNLVRDLMLALVAMLVALLIFGLTRRMQMRLEKEQLQRENLMVRYEALESQMDPHFLFNSLNTLGGLIGTDDERAQRYVQQLSATYRYIMQGKRLVTLDEELVFVESYCQMMQIRYGKNLRIERHVEEKLLHNYIVPISVQLLIENAIKHNVVSDRYPLQVEITTTANSIIVSNAIHPKQDSGDTSGMGLANLSKRYELLSLPPIGIAKHDDRFEVEVPLVDPQAATKIMERLNDEKDKRL